MNTEWTGHTWQLFYMHKTFSIENLKQAEVLEDLGVDGMIILQ
jgi:hypothetical protein